MNKLADKTCIITGASNGIGKAIAKLLAKNGGRVIITDIAVKEGNRLAHEITATGAECQFIEHNVTSENDWQGVIDGVIQRYGKFDVLVNNAGGGTYNEIETLSLSEWRNIIALNLDSVFLGTQMAVKAMKDTGGGSIINMSSVGGLVGSPNLVAYSAAKAAVKLLSKSVAIHCGNHGYNIRVNTIHPGLIKTGAGIEMAMKATGMSQKDAENAFKTLHPIGRLGEPDDIAQMALFLASDESSFATGAEFIIDGGYTAQ